MDFRFCGKANPELPCAGFGHGRGIWLIPDVLTLLERFLRNGPDFLNDVPFPSPLAIYVGILAINIMTRTKVSAWGSLEDVETDPKDAVSLMKCYLDMLLHGVSDDNYYAIYLRRGVSRITLSLDGVLVQEWDVPILREGLGQDIRLPMDAMRIPCWSLIRDSADNQADTLSQRCQTERREKR